MLESNFMVMVTSGAAVGYVEWFLVVHLRVPKLVHVHADGARTGTSTY